MKPHTLLFCIIGFLWTAILPAFSHKSPNIIVFLVDDLGWQDTSEPLWNQKTPLNLRYHTPNMERLAHSGLKFTNAYLPKGWSAVPWPDQVIP
jgi:hypothetical protein